MSSVLTRSGRRGYDADVYDAKRDANEGPIVDALTALGCTVYRLNGEPPDLLVGEPRHGRTFLLEVKTADGKLTPSQKKFHIWYKGKIHLVRTVDEAIGVLANYWRHDGQRTQTT